MDTPRFEHNIEMALDAYTTGQKSRFTWAIHGAQAAIPGYHRSRWLLDCTLSQFPHCEVIWMLNSIRDNLLLLPADAL